MRTYQSDLKGKRAEQHKKRQIQLAVLAVLLIALAVFLLAASGYTNLASFAKYNQKNIVKLNSNKARKAQGTGGGRVGASLTPAVGQNFDSVVKWGAQSGQPGYVHLNPAALQVSGQPGHYSWSIGDCNGKKDCGSIDGYTKSTDANGNIVYTKNP